MSSPIKKSYRCCLLHARDCYPEGSPGRGWLEHARIRQGLRVPYSLDTKWRNRAEFANNRDEARAFLERMEKRTGLSLDQGAVGLRGQPHRGALRL